MKILFVAIPNHHFFQWVNQLKGAGHEVHWFDVTDGSDFVEKINWVHQIRGWKMRYDFPFRYLIKKRFPKIYSLLQKLNERKVASQFEKTVIQLQPDLVHCFEMNLSGMPILEVLNKYHDLPLAYSSWGSDLFSYAKLGLKREAVESFLSRTNFLITDCHRDFEIAKKHHFSGQYLGMFPGNGGISIPKNAIKQSKNRTCILIKGYDDQFGKALKVIEALELLDINVFKNIKIVVYSAEKSVVLKMKSSPFFSSLNWSYHSRDAFFENPKLLALMGESILHIGNSISDGMPNALLEAMGMGAFPIQSNPGGVTEEVIQNGVTGLLIENPMDSKEIAQHIETALRSSSLRENAQDYNVKFIETHYNRQQLRSKIVDLYPAIAPNK